MEVVPVGSETYNQVLQFLYDEAQILDERRWADWLECFTEDVAYQMPVRVTKEHSLERSFLEDMDHFCEDLESLTRRVRRLETEYAWTEDPPSRTRHFVTNVRVYKGEKDDELTVKSYFLLFRSRGDQREAEFLAGERTDTLRRVGDKLKIARRLIMVDESVLRTQNLAIFL